MKKLNPNYLKPKQLCLLLMAIFAMQSCLKDKSSPCKQTKDYFYLDATAKSKVPYLKPEFDTLSFASNKGDTLVFVRQPKDSGWYCKSYYSNMDCSPDYNCYETYGAKYTCIKGNGSFEFKHWYRTNEIDLGFSIPNYFDYGNVVQIRFYDKNFVIFTDGVDDNRYSKFIGDTIVFSKKYYNALFEFNEIDNVVGKGFYNKDFGLFLILDNQNKVNWTLVKP